VSKDEVEEGDADELASRLRAMVMEVCMSVFLLLLHSVCLSWFSVRLLKTIEKPVYLAYWQGNWQIYCVIVTLLGLPKIRPWLTLIRGKRSSLHVVQCCRMVALSLFQTSARQRG